MFLSKGKYASDSQGKGFGKLDTRPPYSGMRFKDKRLLCFPLLLVAFDAVTEVSAFIAWVFFNQYFACVFCLLKIALDF